jgi:hypothetical protein
MSEEVKVTKITMEVGGKTITLSVDDAKKVRDALNEIFGTPTDIKVLEKEIIRDHYPPYYPCITWEKKDYDIPEPMQIYYNKFDNTLKFTC